MKKMLFDIYHIVREKFQRASYLKSLPNTFNLSKSQIKKANKMGFSADEYVIYNLEQNTADYYLREWDRIKYRNKAINWRALFDNKIAFYFIAKSFIPTNEIYAYKSIGKYVALNSNFDTFDNVINQIKTKGRVVYKLINAGGGKGFHLLEFRDGILYDNRKECDKNQISELLNSPKDFLIEECCCQSDFENMLFPYSVNTLRLVTMLIDGEIKLAYAYHRMGAVKDSTVDNLHQGGLFCEIDIETGTMSSAESTYSTCFTKNTSNGTVKYDIHPVTGFKIEGTIVPNWMHIKSTVIEAHNNLLFTGSPFIAWDIALTNDGLKVIEGNTSCGLDIIQRTKGHRYDSMGLFFKEQGII